MTTPGPVVPVICPPLSIVSGPVLLMPVVPWMMAPELLLICPPAFSTTASLLTFNCAPESMLIVTFVLPGVETIAVVTGLGGLVSQVTVCPVVGVTVGVQAARTGSTDQQSQAVASAKIDAVEDKLARTYGGALSTCRGTNDPTRTRTASSISPVQGYARPKVRDSRRRIAVRLNLPLR